MLGRTPPDPERGWTRAGFPTRGRGGCGRGREAAIGARGDDGASLAAPSAETDAKLLNLSLLLEYLQEASIARRFRRHGQATSRSSPAASVVAAGVQPGQPLARLRNGTVLETESRPEPHLLDREVQDRNGAGLPGAEDRRTSAVLSWSGSVP